MRTVIFGSVIFGVLFQLLSLLNDKHIADDIALEYEFQNLLAAHCSVNTVQKLEGLNKEVEQKEKQILEEKSEFFGFGPRHRKPKKAN